MDVKEQINLIKRNVIDLVDENELSRKINLKGKLRVKLGVDPTAPDIHLGHTVVLQKLRTFQDLGHEVIFIIGDFTAAIGDPSGRSETRPSLAMNQIIQNAQTYQEQVFRILDKNKTQVVYNSQWLNELGLAGIINLMKKYTVAQILTRDDFAKRYTAGSPITLLEFLYPLLQGYDSVAVKSDIEIGGTDQKFNLLVGRDLQKDFGQEPQVVITMPLLEGIDGIRKMSKSYNNYIGLTDSAKEIYGKVMSIPDTLTVRYFQLITNCAPDINLHPRDLKAKLAFILTEQYTDAQQAQSAAAEFERVFRKHSLPDEIVTVSVPVGKYSLIHILVFTGLATSKRAAQRFIQQGSVRVNNEKWGESISDLVVDREYIIQIGRRQFRKILPQETNQ